MKTSHEMMKALRLRLYDANSGADVMLPATLVADMVDDLLAYHKEQEALDRGFASLMATVDEDKTTKMPASPTPLRQRPHLSIVKDPPKDPPKGGDAA